MPCWLWQLIILPVGGQTSYMSGIIPGMNIHPVIDRMGLRNSCI